MEVVKRLKQIEEIVMPRVLSNILGIFNSEDREVGGAVYPFVHVFNHSCYTNSVSEFRDSQLRVQAMRDIYEGEEVNRYVFTSTQQFVFDSLDSVYQRPSILLFGFCLL